jgi:hypothetical protein
MTRKQRVRFLTIAAVLFASGTPAMAQVNVGSGPLTRALADTEPTTGVLTVGPVKLAPGLVVREIGWDSNVFDEAENPKDDFIISATPDVAAFTRLRFAQLSAYAGGELNYFNTYSQERSAGYHTRARADIPLSRLRPFVGLGKSRTRTRPNGEIDVRADRSEEEISGGVAFDVSRYGQVYGAAYRFRTRFEDAFEDGVNLAPALGRDTWDYTAGMRTELTPFTSLTVSASYRDDIFRFNRNRDAHSRIASAELRIAPEAVVSGLISVGFNDFRPRAPEVRPYRGLIGMVGIVYPFLEIGRVGVEAVRRNEFSFEESDAYFIENSLTLTYTHVLFGELDAQVRGSKSWFNYGFTETSPARQDKLDVIGGSVGYNLRNRTRISMNYEVGRRRSLELPERNYDRRRVFLAWTFAI